MNLGERYFCYARLLFHISLMSVALKSSYSKICTQRSLEFILKLSRLNKKTQRQYRDVLKFSIDQLVTFYVLHSTFLIESSRPRCFVKKSALRNFANSWENTCEFPKISKNNFSAEHLRTTASVYLMLLWLS